MHNNIHAAVPVDRIELSAEQVSHFHSNGYLHLANALPQRFLSTATLALKHWVDITIDTWIDQSLLANDFSRSGFGTRLYQAWIASGKPEFSTAEPLLSSELFHAVEQDRLLSISMQLLDAHNVVPIEGSFFRAKLPQQDGTSIPWHQDAQCISPITDDDFVTLWIPLVDVDLGNSCLEIVDTTLNQTMYERCFPAGAPYVGMLDRDIQNLGNKRRVSMRRGDILCIHKFLPHRSLNNVSERIRWSMDVRYQKA